MEVGVLYICTGKYIRFWDEFYRTAEEKLLPGVPKHYFVFTDQPFAESALPHVTHVFQANLGWPDNTLRRFHMFLKVEEALQTKDYLYFFNANCRFLQPIGHDFLPSKPENLLVVQHPGQVDKTPDQFPYERNRRSRASIPYGQGKDYVCGGVNGGTTETFLAFCHHAKQAIDDDFRDGVVAQWHDESHINRYILDHPHEIRHAGHCYPQGWTLNSPRLIEVRDKQQHGGRDSLRSPGKQLQEEQLVTVAVYGGLGNQLFQYAAGRALSLRNQCRLQLDTRHYDTNDRFAYGLGHFDIQAVVGTDRTLPPPKSRRLKHLAWRYWGAKHRLLRESGLRFDPAMTRQQGSVYLKGYWQSESYFAEFREIIQQELTMSEPAQPKVADCQESIQSGPSIAVHVRRGDYISNRKASSLYGQCTVDYYRAAVRYLLDHCPQRATAYVFSDDADWAREHLRLDCPTHYMDHGNPPQDDLRLISSCDHQVIANSTFSWWGAWLNRSPTKVVVAPTPWFADSRVDGSSIVPADWVRMDSCGLLAAELAVA